MTKPNPRVLEVKGVFVEPASAASIGGAIRDIKAGKIAEGSVIVCTVTGNGLKDPDTAIKQCADAVMLTINATLDDVRTSILSNMENNFSCFAQKKILKKPTNCGWFFYCIVQNINCIRIIPIYKQFDTV